MTEKSDFEKIIRKLGYIPHDTVIETVIVNSENVGRRKKEVKNIINLRSKHLKEKGAKKADLAAVKRVISDKISSGRSFIIAKDKKRRKAIGYISVFRPSAKDETGMIDFVYVSPEYRRIGMGKKLERKGVYYLMKKEGTKFILGRPLSIGGEKLAKFRIKLTDRAETGEFDEALRKWQLKKKNPKRVRRK